LTRKRHPLLRFSLLQGLASSRFARPPFRRASLSDLSCPTAPSDSPATTSRFQPRVSTTSTVSHRHRGHPSGKSLQAYFIPQALLGLPFRGFPSNAGSETYATDFPSCRSQWPLAFRAVLGIQREAWVDFRVLPNIRIRAHCRSALAQPARPIPSWVFSSLGFFLPKTMGSLRRHLSCTYQSRTPLRVFNPGALQSLLRLRWSNPLSRFRSPFQGFLPPSIPLRGLRFGRGSSFSTARPEGQWPLGTA